MREDQPIERAAAVAIDERESADKQVAHVHDIRVAETNDDVGLGVRVRQVRELERLVVVVQRRGVRERDDGQRLARASRDGLIGGRVYLVGAEPLAHVVVRDDHGAGSPESIVATGVIAVQMRVDHELHRLLGQHRHRRADFRHHVGELVVDDGGAVPAHREADVAAASDQHVDAGSNGDGFDFDILRRCHGRGWRLLGCLLRRGE